MLLKGHNSSLIGIEMLSVLSLDTHSLRIIITEYLLSLILCY